MVYQVGSGNSFNSRLQREAKQKVKMFWTKKMEKYQSDQMLLKVMQVLIMLKSWIRLIFN